MGVYVLSCNFFSSKLETKKRQLARLEEQLQKLEVQATDKVCGSIMYSNWGEPE